VNWDENDLKSAFCESMGSVQVTLEKSSEERHISDGQMERWFGSGESSYGMRTSYGERLRQAGLSLDEVRQVNILFRRSLLPKPVLWDVTTTYIIAK
jgi:hypothetical protein